MRAMSKQELADCAGVSVRTLMNWCEPYQTELRVLGLKRFTKILNPGIVAFICDKCCIDIED